MRKLSPLAEEFSQVMNLLSWSQSETARRLFITPSHVNQIVHGRAEPSQAMVQLLKLTAVRMRPELNGKLSFAAAPPPKKVQKPVETTELDEADQFWEQVKRRRLLPLPLAERRELLQALGTLLRIHYRPATPGPRRKDRR